MSQRGPIRRQQDFLKLIANLSNCSYIQTEGKSYKATIYTFLYNFHKVANNGNYDNGDDKWSKRSNVRIAGGRILHGGGGNVT